MNILRIIYRMLPFLAVALTIGFLGWLLSLHGTMGLLHVNASFRLGFIIILIAVILLAGLAVWQILLARKPGNRLVNWFIGPVVLLTVIELIFPVAGILYLSTPLSPPTEVPHPLLLLSDRESEAGIPDVAVANYTATPTREILTWGNGESDATLTENTATKQHVFILTGLLPDTEYWYRIDDGILHHFATPSIAGDTLHFAVASDAHFGADTARNDLTVNILENISNPKNEYDYFFSVGDLVEYGFSDTQWETALKSLTPTISEIPVALIAGNHDTLFTGLARYEYFCYPSAIVSASGSPLWHRYDVGNVHFLCLDVEWSAESFTAEQAVWLEAQLKSIPEDDWKIVMQHGYCYASGSIINGWKWYDNPETIDDITPLFEEYGVDMVFSGHVHQMELLQHSGVTYIIAGTFGGSPEREYTYKSPDSLWYAGDQYGFVDVTLDNNTAEIVFRDPAYQVLKSFTLNK